MEYFSSNYTQIPNIFFEKLLPNLTHSETRVLLVMMYKTFQTKGSETSKLDFHELFEKTGLSRISIYSALRALRKKEIVETERCEDGRTKFNWFFLKIIEDKKQNVAKDKVDSSGFLNE